MKLFRVLFLGLGLITFSSYAQEAADIEALPEATLTTNYVISFPDAPMTTAYYIDVAHLGFENQTDGEKKLDYYLTGNLVTPELNFEEGYVILHVHTEYMGGDLDMVKLTNYVNNNLNKPTH